MAKEDTRAEIEQDIRNIDEKINDILSQETIDFSELTKLQDEKERLEKLLTLGEKDDEIEDNQEQEQRENEQDEVEDNNQEEQDVEEEIYDNREPEAESNTPEEWRRESGIRALGLQEAREYTREEFLGQPGIVYMVELPGRAENFLGKDAKEWDKIKTSVSCLYDAVRDNRFPAKINNEETYILLQYDKDKVMDRDKNPDEPGYARIDKNDIEAATTEEDKENDDEKYEDTEKEENTDKKQGICKSIWNKAQDVMESKELRKILAKVILKDIVPEILAVVATNPKVATGIMAAKLATSIVGKEILEGVTRGAMDAVGNDMQRETSNPNMGNEEKPNEEELEEEFLPGFPPPMH